MYYGISQPDGTICTVVSRFDKKILTVEKKKKKKSERLKKNLPLKFPGKVQ